MCTPHSESPEWLCRGRFRASNWCIELNEAMMAHPHLTNISTGHHVPALEDYVNDLIEAILQEGISNPLAAEYCWSLADLTIDDAMRCVRSWPDDGRPSSVEDS
jgi:hypothetical protein